MRFRGADASQGPVLISTVALPPNNQYPYRAPCSYYPGCPGDDGQGSAPSQPGGRISIYAANINCPQLILNTTGGDGGAGQVGLTACRDVQLLMICNITPPTYLT